MAARRLPKKKPSMIVEYIYKDIIVEKSIKMASVFYETKNLKYAIELNESLANLEWESGEMEMKSMDTIIGYWCVSTLEFVRFVDNIYNDPSYGVILVGEDKIEYRFTECFLKFYSLPVVERMAYNEPPKFYP